MKYLTVTEYARLYGKSHQAISDRIKRGTLDLVEVKLPTKRIPVDDAEYERLLQNALAPRKGRA